MPGIELSGLDFPAIAAGFGCRASSVTEPADLPGALAAALADDRPHVLHVTIESAVPGLLG